MESSSEIYQFVEKLTAGVFAAVNQPISDRDLRTTINIVFFFARVIHIVLRLIFGMLYVGLVLHDEIKKIIIIYRIKIFTGLIMCVFIHFVDINYIHLDAAHKINHIPIIPIYMAVKVGEFVVGWSHYYVWYIIFAGFSYALFQIFMSFMRPRDL